MPYSDPSSMDDSSFSMNMNTPIMNSIDEFTWMTVGSRLNDATSTTGASYSSPVSSSVDLPTPSTIDVSETTIPAHESANLQPYSSSRRPFLQSPKSAAPTVTSKHVSRRRSSSSTRTRLATGTRPNITIGDLVPLDAPTQTHPRKSSSGSSNKVPAASQYESSNKRSSSLAFNKDSRNENEDDDKDHKSEHSNKRHKPQEEPDGSEVLPSPSGPNVTETEKEAYKRRRGTLAARKSRRRKLEHKVMLERTVEELESDRNKWRARCTVLQEILRSRNVNFNFEDDEFQTAS